MKASCVLCAVVLVLVLDLFTKTCADEENDETVRPSSAWLNGNKAFHLFQRQSRWGARLRNGGRPQGRAPRSYDPDVDDDADDVQVFRRWGSRRMPHRGAGHKRVWEGATDEEAGMNDIKRDGDDDEQAMVNDVIEYLRNKED